MDQWTAERGRQSNVAVNCSYTSQISFASPGGKEVPRFLLSLDQEGTIKT